MLVLFTKNRSSGIADAN